jgi:hypothetical protein
MKPRYLHVRIPQSDQRYWVDTKTRQVHRADGTWLGPNQRVLRTDLDLKAAIDLWAGFANDTGSPSGAPGTFYPRVFRPEMPPLSEKHQRARDEAVHAARSLFRRLDDVFRYIEPRKRNLDVYGHETRGLLILACNEVESGLKSVLRENGHRPVDSGGKRIDADRWNLDKNYIECADMLRLREWGVRLSGRLDLGELRPFALWKKGSAPGWWSAYNGVKHDREKKFERATLANCIDALAAVVVVITAQFGSWTHANPFSPLWATQSASREQDAMAPFQLVTEPAWTAADYPAPPALVGRNGWKAKGRWA